MAPTCSPNRESHSHFRFQFGFRASEVSKQDPKQAAPLQRLKSGCPTSPAVWSVTWKASSAARRSGERPLSKQTLARSIGRSRGSSLWAMAARSVESTPPLKSTSTAPGLRSWASGGPCAATASVFGLCVCSSSCGFFSSAGCQAASASGLLGACWTETQAVAASRGGLQHRAGLAELGCYGSCTGATRAQTLHHSALSRSYILLFPRRHSCQPTLLIFQNAH